MTVVRFFRTEVDWEPELIGGSILDDPYWLIEIIEPRLSQGDALADSIIEEAVDRPCLRTFVAVSQLNNLTITRRGEIEDLLKYLDESLSFAADPWESGARVCVAAFGDDLGRALRERARDTVVWDQSLEES